MASDAGERERLLTLAAWRELRRWEWGVWLGADYVVSYYDGMYTVMDRRTGETQPIHLADLPQDALGEHFDI
jgi:hypothetical protein